MIEEDRWVNCHDGRLRDRLLAGGRLLFGAIAPRRCSGCDAPDGAVICDGCRRRIQSAPAPAPRSIGRAVVAAAAFGFEEPLRRVLHRGKYAGYRRAIEALVALAVARLGPWLQQRGCTLVVPVPLARRRGRRRGFNQAELLALALRDAAGAELSRDLSRVRETGSQAGHDLAFRQANVRGAFRWRGGDLSGARVCLVDDVLTTGATVEAASAPLMEGGAGAVDVAVIAAVL